MQRRAFLYLSGLLAERAHAWDPAGGQAMPPSEYQESARRHLARLTRTRQEVDDWLAERAFPFSKYDGELGYLHRNRRFKEGIDKTICTYTYDQSDARHAIMHADRPCRINTYGNSFTACEQVSDGETWQEVLAAFLGEPVRNYGIGSYSVYQAYLRMKREERRNPAPYIIFNIFDDDHFRNLVSYQAIARGKIWQAFCPPVPYVVVDLEAGQMREMANPCPTAESLYNLCDPDWVVKTFGDDFLLKIMVARKWGTVPNGIDMTTDPFYRRVALLATTRIVEKVEEFATAHNKKVLYVLSCDQKNVMKRLQGEKRFDQSLVDFLEARKLPYIDLLEVHAADYQKFKPGIQDYLSSYYIGHYSPQGNVFCAFAIRNKLAAMLDPKPEPYSAPYSSRPSS